MDFEDTTAEAEWRAECDDWLRLHLPRLENVDRTPVAQIQAWQAMKFEAGLAKITWGPDEGGRHGTDVEQIIFGQEEAAHRTPFDLLKIGLDFIAPTLRAHGTAEQRARYLLPLLRGETLWCQMFSEPGAGSDLAGLATSAVRDGDEWVLNGQKVWTSYAQFADYGEVLCRTNPDAPKHEGLTAFVVDLKAPGVTVRPLRQMTGSAEFNEIFLDDVRVPHADVIGGVDEGWHVAVTTLSNERRSLGSGGSRRSRLPGRLADLARHNGTLDNVTRLQIVELHILSEVSRFLTLRTLTAALHGRRPGPEGSVGKLAVTRREVAAANLGMSLLGASGMAAEPEEQRWVTKFLWGPGHRLGGGTDEVNRNIVAERALGLPGEPRHDDTVPWREVPRSVR